MTNKDVAYIYYNKCKAFPGKKHAGRKFYASDGTPCCLGAFDMGDADERPLDCCKECPRFVNNVDADDINS